ncbi:BTB/POZ domain-containing adapter for CUL3-mediated RhoA degradation protein 1 isoform X1 [Callithrix jacchus]|uniref:BTB/POZ domain-containing adapter for CUL3-mediated RhoA degradation protein 1 isoform X1 n=1 Tax=Callithrix jacchus TaxID=9483 RepID=UPI00083F9EF3|nr:BTB/POZ domain-containing adapter for CUL3-mediated RhoA degradation protein 1 isoform X1 [Callithrix jacchus]
MSAEASGPAAAAAPSLETPKLSGLEPGSAAYGLKPLTPNSKYVKLNVGGSLHYTTLRTLTGQDTMLKAMFSGRVEVLTDAGGWVLIDRSGRHFGTILNYLRDGSVPLPESTRELGELLGEARYYLVQGLIDDCQLALQVGDLDCLPVPGPTNRVTMSILQKRETLSPLCLIPTVTSPREEQQLLASTSKPVVKLLHNRSNNKYSYTSTSDDNLLKNIELFDKLALRFHGRLLFLKDVLGDEICCWSFYGQGRKIAEVCCTSIVYATEKKQTKVEFPEARIFEETLNILIYETPRGPDPALLEATGGAAGAGGAGRGEDEENREHRVRRIHVRRHITHDERPHGQQIVFKD